jgi:23S rRNA (cytosine1962-C5)-methyltransferase
VIREVLAVDEGSLFTRMRQRKEGREGQYTKLGEENAFFTVEEAGLKFRVNLSDYLDTGLFLDHRITRSMVRQESAGKKVLNLFCYTGSFSVYAAAGGATNVCSVDMSNTYLEWARKNFELNGFAAEPRFTFVRADVTEFLHSVVHERYDLIVVDPPTFSNSKMMEGTWDIQRDHVWMLNALRDWLLPGGRVYFSTNYRRFILNREELKFSQIKDITRATTPFDFAGKLQRQCFVLG